MRRDRCGTVEREDVRERYGTRRGKPGVAQAGYLVLREGDGEAEEGAWPGGEWQGRRGRKGKLK